MSKTMLFQAERYASPTQAKKLHASMCPYCGGTCKRLYHRLFVTGRTSHQWVPKGWYCLDCQAVFIEGAA